MIETPEVTQSVPVRTAYIHLTIPRDEIRQVMGPGLRELFEAVAAQGRTPAGPWFTHHLRMDPDQFDFRICVPVDAPVTPAGRVQGGEMPARKVARTVYHGGYEGLHGAWSELMAWIEERGLTPAADLWECYVAGPESGSDPAAWRTELFRPLAQ